MTNILLLGGTDKDNGDYSLLASVAQSSTRTLESWSTLKTARAGDRVWFYIPAPKSAVVAAGVALGDAVPGNDWPYMMPVGELAWLPRPIPLQELREKFPSWTWAKKARGRTNLPDDVADYLSRDAAVAEPELIGALEVAPELEQQVAEAEAVLLQALPEVKERSLVLNRLLESARIAEAVAPRAWGVTLFSNGFRLNVGQVEVLVLGPHNRAQRSSGRPLRVNLLAQLGVRPIVGPRFVATMYQSMPESQCAFVGTVAEYAEVEGAITDAHEAFVERAASTRSGKPRVGTPFRRSHHEGILEFGRRILGLRDDIPSRPPRIDSENGQQASSTKDTPDEPSFTYDDAFPVIARLILVAARSEPQRFVRHDAIVDLVLADRRGAEIVAQARPRSAWADDREAASNMVAWFSQQISVGRSEWLQLFERERINGAWAYRRAAIPTMGQSADADIAVIEGEPRMFFHARREREPRIVAAKRVASRNESGELQCEACGFVARHAYSGFAGDVAEVHHRRPLAEATGPVETTLDDLAILCANCHRAIHQTRPMLTVDEFRVRFLSGG